jgi:NAD dependent epimerase/dehydratase
VERLVRDGLRVRALVHYNSASNWNNLHLLDREIFDQLEVVPGDITDPYVVNQAVSGCDVVFHLASLISIPYSYTAPSSYVQTNVIGSLNVFQACLSHNVSRVVHTSTSEVYGTARYTPMDENHPLQAQSPYSASKIGADKQAEGYHCSFGLPVAVIRPFNTYGPRQSARAVIPTILSQLLSGASAIHLGSLEPVRDFLFVEDTVEAFLSVIRSDDCVGKVTHIGTGRGVTIGDLAKLAMEITGHSATITEDPARVRPTESEVKALLCDPSVARDRCGWQSRTTLEAGLRAVAEFIEAHPGRYRPSEYAV